MNDPGKWSAAVAGTNEIGESYKQNIVREIFEEIRVKNLELSEGPKQFIDGSKHIYYCQWFLGRVIKENLVIIPQEDEVESTR